MASSLEAHVQKHLRFNFTIGMFDGGFFGLGAGFASFAAIIPLFVSHFTDSALLIGLVPAIHNVGWQLPQLLTAGWISRAKRYKPLTLWMTIHERVPYLGLAVVALCVPFTTKRTTLIMAFLMLIWQGLGSGLAANPWTNMVTKVMPRELHGTFFGTQSAAYNGMAGISAIMAGLILDKMAMPYNYSLCFALTFASMCVSFIFLSTTREPESTPNESDRSNVYLGKSLEILRRDANFQIFVGIRMLSQFAGMGFAFYVIYAVRQFGMSDAAAGIMVAILLIGQVVLSPLMGRWGDRWSHRGVMSLGALGAALSALLAWQATSANWFYAVFILEAIATVAIWTVPIALSVSFAKSDDERPLYIGLSNTLCAPVTILAPVIGGWLADAASFSLTFLISAVCGFLMMFALWFIMKDPRKENFG
ncbi:MAG TPA: MFS transporter [Anaerolineales bacterium]|nr:MFS transporter [Anaerolineales bacterium]